MSVLVKELDNWQQVYPVLEDYLCSNGSCRYCHIHYWCGDVAHIQEGMAPLSQTPPPGTDHYEMVDEGEKRAPLGAGVYEEINKQDTQTDEHTKHYQELYLAKMEKRTMQLSKLDCIFV